MASTFRTPTSLSEVRQYVTAPSDVQHQSHDTVLLNITHSNLQRTRFPEIRLSKSISISDLKTRLYSHTGTLASSMRLTLYNATGGLVANLDDDSGLLGYYSPKNNYTIHIVDLDPASISRNAGLEDLSSVEKYRMSDEDYAARPDTYVKFKEEMKKKDPSWTLTGALSGKAEADPRDTGAEHPGINIGDRAEVYPGERRGTVKFVGRDLDALPPGWWIGIEYDEPLGKNDGKVGGKRYFQCQQGYGGFVRPSFMKIGDFPPLDDDMFDSDDEI